MLESSFMLLREIGVLVLSDTEEVHFSIDAYRGYRYVSVRRFLRTENFAGPTRDGVTFTPEMIRAFVPVLNQLPADIHQLKLGPIAKLAKRPGICIVATVADFRAEHGLDLRQWEQDKGFTKKGIWLPLSKWTEIRQLFAAALAAIDEVPDVDF